MLKHKKKKHRLPVTGVPVVAADQALPIPVTLSADESAKRKKKKKLDANDVANMLGADGVLQFLEAHRDRLKACARRTSQIISFARLNKLYPKLRPPIIHGLLRKGETMNLIAAPKMGKSMLVGNLIMSLISGGTFLGKFQCESCRVLVVDNELH